MKKYAAPLLLLLFTATANAANSYNSSTNTLMLDAIVVLQTATKFTGVVVQLSNVQIFGEDLTPPRPDEFATYDTNLNIITIPSITYQDGSQHYHVRAVVDSFSPANPGAYAGIVSLPCYYFNIEDMSKVSQINAGMTYSQVNQIIGCPLSNISWEDYTAQGIAPKTAIMTWSAPDASYAINITFDASAANIAGYTVINISLIEEQIE